MLLTNRSLPHHIVECGFTSYVFLEALDCGVGFNTNRNDLAKLEKLLDETDAAGRSLTQTMGVGSKLRSKRALNSVSFGFVKFEC